MRVRSSIDVFNREEIVGWVVDLDRPKDRIGLEIVLNGRVIGSLTAEHNRPDLLEARISDGNSGFVYPVPKFLPGSYMSGKLLRDFSSPMLESERIQEVGAIDPKAIPGAVDRDTVQACNDAIATIWDTCPPGSLIETWEPDGQFRLIPTNKDFRPGRTKLLDPYTHSSAIRTAMAPPRVIEFLRAVFEDKPKAFQGLGFWYGSQQRIHKDSAYVKIDSNPLALVATWLALEDIEEGTGELVYYVGSHRAPAFLFGGASRWMEHAPTEDQAFLDSLDADAHRFSQPVGSFLAKAGDVLIWHGDLAHGGSAITQPGRTRKSLVTHFTRASDEPYYRRDQRHHQLETPTCTFVSNYMDVPADCNRVRLRPLFRRLIPRSRETWWKLRSRWPWS